MSRLFKQLGNTHYHNDGCMYKKGDVLKVPNHVDLAASFKNMFEEVTGKSKKIAVGVPVNRNAKMHPRDPKDEAPAKKKTSISGKEVTASFQDAVDQDFVVYKRDGLYFVYDRGQVKPINPNGSTRGKVSKVIANQLAKERE